MLLRNLDSGQTSQQTLWQELGEGAPTIIGLAQLAAARLDAPLPAVDQLTPEAQALLVAAGPRGTMDIRANREPFDSSERLLAICVERPDHSHLWFLRPNEPEQTIRFLNGFRELCAHGLAMHQLQKEFSLTANGYLLARQLDPAAFDSLLEFAVEVAH